MLFKVIGDTSARYYAEKSVLVCLTPDDKNIPEHYYIIGFNPYFGNDTGAGSTYDTVMYNATPDGIIEGWSFPLARMNTAGELMNPSLQQYLTDRATDPNRRTVEQAITNLPETRVKAELKATEGVEIVSIPMQPPAIMEKSSADFFAENSDT